MLMIRIHEGIADITDAKFNSIVRNLSNKSHKCIDENRLFFIINLTKKILPFSYFK